MNADNNNIQEELGVEDFDELELLGLVKTAQEECVAGNLITHDEVKQKLNFPD